MATRRKASGSEPITADNEPRGQKAFVLGRGANGRPVLQHATRDLTVTSCGRQLAYMGTRYYLKRPIFAMLCKKCGKIENIDIDAGLAKIGE